jgi:hypothetical protein
MSVETRGIYPTQPNLERGWLGPIRCNCWNELLRSESIPDYIIHWWYALISFIKVKKKIKYANVLIFFRF